jgi:hypothetical protein
MYYHRKVIDDWVRKIMTEIEEEWGMGGFAGTIYEEMTISVVIRMFEDMGIEVKDDTPV